MKIEIVYEQHRVLDVYTSQGVSVQKKNESITLSYISELYN